MNRENSVMRKALLALGAASMIAAAGVATSPEPAQALFWHHWKAPAPAAAPVWWHHHWPWFHHFTPPPPPKAPPKKKKKKKKKAVKAKG
jgi:hypothetical protein